MARYRLTGEVHINGDVRVLARMEQPKTPDGEPEMVRLRADMQNQACVLLHAGTEIEVADEVVPGVVWEPIDDAAKAAVAKIDKPKWHADVNALPAQLDMRDPMDQIDKLAESMGRMGDAVTKLVQTQEPKRAENTLKLKQ